SPRGRSQTTTHWFALARDQLGGSRPSGSPPPPATEEELEELRTRLRACQVAVVQEAVRLAALQQARERAHGERYAALAAVDEAEAVWRQARQFGRQHLVVAYLNQQEVGGPLA